MIWREGGKEGGMGRGGGGGAGVACGAPAQLSTTKNGRNVGYMSLHCREQFLISSGGVRGEGVSMVTATSGDRFGCGCSDAAVVCECQSSLEVALP